MGQDYYSVLNLQRNASETDVKKSYRKLALKWHPKRNSHNIVQAQKQFELLSEAYQVLSNGNTRAVFDLYGENGLKNGVADDNRGFLKETGEATFNSFFGTSEPFQAEEIDNRVLSTNDNGLAPKPNCIKQILYVTLEDLFSGCVRRIHVERRVLNSDGMSTRMERFPISVGVAPGTPSGTRLLFAGKGHQDVTSTARGDVEFEIEEIPHPKFRRQGDTLVYFEKIYISEALAGKIVSIELLNGRKLSLPITKIVYPGFIQVLKGHGMPIGGGRHGDLHIHFDIEFPTSLSADVKGRLKTLLPVPHKKEST